jgi:hypothetical protein
VVTIPAGSKISSQQAPGAEKPEATPKRTPDEIETVASAQTKRSTSAGPREERPVMGRYRLAVLGIVACSIGMAAIGTIVWLARPKSRSVQPHTSASERASASVAAGKAPGAEAPTGPVTSPEPQDRYPRFADAVHRLPDWLARDCPFDVNEFSPEIPWDENAAPLYLEALAEFSAEVASCFPAEERERILGRARERMERYTKFMGRWGNDALRFQKERTDSDNAELDKLLEDYRAGLQKLALAQERKRCLFETGISLSSLAPHVQAARQVVPILHLKSIRELDRQDVAAAIGSLEAGLRLSRDLRPRGFAITQLVSGALNIFCLRQMVPEILRAPLCSREQCDRLLALLRNHRRQAPDSWVTRLRSEYVVLRDVINGVQNRTGDFAPDRAKDVMAAYGRSTSATSAGDLLFFLFNQNAAQTGAAKEVAAINTRLDLMSEKEYAQEAKAAADWYLALEPIGRKPPAQQSAALIEIQARFNTTLFVSRWQSAVLPSLNFIRRDETLVGGTLCLVALKRWLLTHREPPPDLTTMLAKTGAGEVPIDPYSGKPLSFTVVGGKPTIYSIGPDGIDDHGEFDNLDGRNASGDMLFQLR